MTKCGKLAPFLTIVLAACGGAAPNRSPPVVASGFDLGGLLPPSVPPASPSGGSTGGVGASAGGGSVGGGNTGSGASAGGGSVGGGNTGGGASAGGASVSGGNTGVGASAGGGSVSGGSTGGGASAGGGSASGGNTGGGAGGGSAGGGGSTGGGGSASGGTAPARCLVAPLLAQLGRGKLLVGADMNDAVAASAPFDVRAQYIAGGLADGSEPCASCATGCTAAGRSCDGAGPGCGWWGCWQDDRKPPGQYLRSFLAKTKAAGQLPLVTYYQLLQTSGAAEGPAEVAAVSNPALMTRFFNDFRFALQQIGGSVALLHLEPDFWGFAEQVSEDAHRLPAAVASVNPDCAGQENSVAGFGRCLIAMTRKYAPNAKVGLHGSSWGTGIDATLNSNPSVDVAAEGRKLADFLLQCGAGDSDFVAIDASDRDAGFTRSEGRNTSWDATDATLPSFRQAFAWARALTGRLGRPALWWQLPLGNLSLPNAVNQWQDNRVDYFFSHPADVARTNALGMVFGPGDGKQTKASTDNGYFVSRVRALSGKGGQPACF